MKKIIIHTENKNLSSIKKLAGRYFPGFTIVKGTGFWQGTEEKSVAIEIITSKNGDIKKSKQLAEDIKILNQQQAVLLSIEKIQGIFI